MALQSPVVTEPMHAAVVAEAELAVPAKAVVALEADKVVVALEADKVDAALELDKADAGLGLAKAVDAAELAKDVADLGKVVLELDKADVVDKADVLVLHQPDAELTQAV